MKDSLGCILFPFGILLAFFSGFFGGMKKSGMFD